MLVKNYSSAVFGIDVTTITIEVNASAHIKFFLRLDLFENIHFLVLFVYSFY